MKNYLFLAAGAALSLASCSQEKTTETTTGTAGTPGTTTTSTTTSTTMYNDDAYKARSQRIADKYAADMKITDAAMREKIRTAYYDRSKRYGELHTKYASDTTGRAAATRDANTATDTEFKGIYTDPTQYQAYESSRSTYDENNYLDDNSSASSAMSADSSGANTSSGSGSMSNSNSAMSGSTSDNAMPAAASGTAESGTVSKSKTKMTDGTKIKVKADGKVKMKDGDGSKLK